MSPRPGIRWIVVCVAALVGGAVLVTLRLPLPWVIPVVVLGFVWALDGSLKSRSGGGKRE